MTIPAPAKFGDRFGLKLLLAVVFVTAAVFAWTSSHYQQQDKQKDTWVDDQGKLHVLGITLGTSDLRQAELALQSRSEIALYLYPVEHPKAGMKLEAYFPSIADHTQVILLLEATPETLKQMEARASAPQLFQNRVARLSLAPEDYQLTSRMTVRELTLIPSVAVTPASLQARFGTPNHIRHLTPASTVYRFSSLGLEAELSEDEAPQLHFSNPVKEGS
ncbi:MAG: hypothetical protein HY306_02885 [Nitrosomonadales bacterium]|nr:hypothetical protein [Nitrosomonadales bacterium]